MNGWPFRTRRPGPVGAALAAATFAVAAIVSWFHWPQPAAHDEFSYLLAADTFCQGRLANPTHPQWKHFETFHVIHEPSYASKYPPGQGAALALGQYMAGEPIVAVWGLSACAAAATYWMLLGFTSPRWGLAGGLLWLAHPGFQLIWGQSYWGGTLAFLGGALVAGAAVRMLRHARTRDAVAMASGALLLATTRPFEGLAYSVLVGLWVATHWVRNGAPPARALVLRLVLPQALLLGGGLLALACYNAAVTGDALTMPYLVHERTYAQCPMFQGQPPRPQTYRHPTIEGFHSGWAMDWYRRQSSARGWINTKAAVTWLAAAFFLTPAMIVGVLLARPVRWRRLTPVVLIATLAFLASLASIWNFPHYMAPFAPLLLVAAVAGLRRADVLSRRRLGGWRVGTALVGVQAVLFAVAAVNHAARPQGGWWIQRAEIAEQLAATGRQHLVLVRYGEYHSPHQEWVYNAANIDAAAVVWARSMDPASDAQLLRHFAGRQAWLLQPEAGSLKPWVAEAAALARHDGGE